MRIKIDMICESNPQSMKGKSPGTESLSRQMRQQADETASTSSSLISPKPSWGRNDPVCLWTRGSVSSELFPSSRTFCATPLIPRKKSQNPPLISAKITRKRSKARVFQGISLSRQGRKQRRMDRQAERGENLAISPILPTTSGQADLVHAYALETVSSGKDSRRP